MAHKRDPKATKGKKVRDRARNREKSKRLTNCRHLGLEDNLTRTERLQKIVKEMEMSCDRKKPFK